MLLVFNRPAQTRRVFAAIRAARPPSLYIAADGPRSGRPEDIAKCKAVRSIVEEVDWPCQVKTLYRGQNLGCRLAISSAIDWLFEHETAGVILEDDVVPGEAFVPFCEELLVLYADDLRVAMIGGFNPWTSRDKVSPESYSFSSYALIWGWATWRRAWLHYDSELEEYQSTKNLDFLAGVPTMGPRGRDMWRSIFNGVVSDAIDTWDYQWFYAMMKTGGLAVLPHVNLVENIGFGLDATHASGAPPTWATAAAEEMPPGELTHPGRIRVNVVLERAFAGNVFLLTPWNEFKFWVKSFIAGGASGRASR